jgi:hypothetical protein
LKNYQSGTLSDTRSQKTITIKLRKIKKLLLDDENREIESIDLRFGLLVTFVRGIILGFFTPAYNIVVNDPFDWYNGGLSLPCVNL